MTDLFDSFTGGLESPPTNLDAATPSDTGDLPTASRALNVGVSGNVRVTTVGGSTQTLYIGAGVAFPVRVEKIWATGTTAENIVVMY